MTWLLSAPEISGWRLLWLLVPVAVVWWTLRATRVGNDRRFLWAATRGTVQLSIIGYLLVPLFALENPFAVLGVMSASCSLAAFFSLGVLGKGPGLSLWGLAVASILPVVVGLTTFALAALTVDIRTFEARYAITLAGMLAGNAMNATAIAGERFMSDLADRRAEIEDRLLLGMPGRQAAAPVVTAALRASVTPSINSLMAVGLVSFPGMMTGQIMAGQSPLPAAVWQLTIMALWTAAATLAPRIFLHLLSGRMLADHRIQEELTPGGAEFRVARYAPDALQGTPAVFDERPPDALTEGFIGNAPEE